MKTNPTQNISVTNEIAAPFSFFIGIIAGAVVALLITGVFIVEYRSETKHAIIRSDCDKLQRAQMQESRDQADQRAQFWEDAYDKKVGRDAVAFKRHELDHTVKRLCQCGNIGHIREMTF